MREILTSLFNRFWARPAAAAPRLAPGKLVYAVGDIHGRDDLLGDLLQSIDDDRLRRSAVETVVVFLGDLIDRGPNSAKVIERLRNYAPAGVRPVFLAGNHEEVLLRLLDGDDSLVANWLKFGGLQCCASYGLDSNMVVRMRSREAGDAIRRAIPASHREFLASFHDTVRIGDYLFVHAGIRPGVALEAQAQSDLRWIRQPFLVDRRDHGFIVVHGHTISDGVDQAANRIGIDTGAYRSGVLTALAASGDSTWFLQTEQKSVRSAEYRTCDGQTDASLPTSGAHAAVRA